MTEAWDLATSAHADPVIAAVALARKGGSTGDTRSGPPPIKASEALRRRHGVATTGGKGMMVRRGWFENWGRAANTRWGRISAPGGKTRKAGKTQREVGNATAEKAYRTSPDPEHVSA